MEPYRTMALNNAWANAALYAAMAPLTEAEFTAARPGFFPSLSETMNHIYAVDLYYVDALEAGGLGRSVYERNDVTDLLALGRLQAESDARFARFCAEMTAEDPARRIRTIRDHAPETTERVDAVILHLIQHQIHHRGQAHVQLQDAGIDPPQLDEFHLEDGRAATARPYFA